MEGGARGVFREVGLVMARFTIGIVGNGAKLHSRCFEDVARGMAYALRTLGHETVEFDDSSPGRLLLFGSNNVFDPDGKMPKDAIIYNSEQVAATRGAALIQNVTQYRSHVIWDYSRKNIEKLKALGIERAVHCPVGYVPSMEVIEASPQDDIDVLHYGSMNPRRARILNLLEARGLKVVRLFGVYGRERDQMIARSKVVVNIHFYGQPIFEIFRVSHLLANRRCVVSEGGGTDLELEDFAGRATRLVSYDDVVEACVELVKDERKRREQAERGYEAFRQADLVENVRKALEESQ